MPDETYLPELLDETEPIPYAEFKLIQLIHPLHSKHYRLKQPISVMIEKENHLVICSLPELHIYGFGDTIDDALQEFEP